MKRISALKEKVYKSPKMVLRITTFKNVYIRLKDTSKNISTLTKIQRFIMF